MLNALGIRTLLASGAVALMTLMTQQPLMADLPLTLSALGPITITEGDKGTAQFDLSNPTGNGPVTLNTAPPTVANVTINPKPLGQDLSDNPILVSVVGWTKGAVLPAATAANIYVSFTTPAIGLNDDEDDLPVKWSYTLSFPSPMDPKTTLTATSTVTVKDPPPVPEGNTGLLLIPLAAAMLFPRLRRLWRASPCRL